MSHNPSGSPVGVFSSYVRAIFGVAAGQQIIAAPAAGLAIYLQSISASTGGANSNPVFKDGAGTAFESINVAAGTVISVFPGGLRLPAASKLQVDVNTNPVDISVRYTIGPAL